MSSFSIAQNSYYDVLDIKPDASLPEVRDAYLRAKSAYNRDSVALYSLIGPEERDEALRNIEEAYIVLSDSERRRDYDKSHGLLNLEEELFQKSPNAKIVSIDRVPPMEAGSENEDLLIPPSTDFTRRKEDPKYFNRPGDLHDPAPSLPPPSPRRLVPSTKSPTAPPPPIDLSGERDWHGALLRAIRESKRISVEEIALATKISKSYIAALEEENFSKLPAAVYVRGFVTQLCRILRLPIEKVLGPYMTRYFHARPDQVR